MAAGAITPDPRFAEFIRRQKAESALAQEALFNIVNSRPSLRNINSYSAPRMVSSAVTGDGGDVPLIYGTQPIQGHIIVTPTVSGAYRYVAIGWCLGQVGSVERIFINDEPISAGVQVRNYTGSKTQLVDSWLAAVIPSYTDDCVIDYRGDRIGICYSVFKIQTSVIDGKALSFKAIINGSIVTDPDLVASTDPYADDNIAEVDFESGGTDSSSNYNLSLTGNAVVDSSGLRTLGTTDSVSELGTSGAVWSLVGNAHSSYGLLYAGSESLRTIDSGDCAVSDIAIIPASVDAVVDIKVVIGEFSGPLAGADKDYLMSIGTGANELSIYIKGRYLAFSYNGSESVGSTEMLADQSYDVKFEIIGDLFSIKMDTILQASNTHIGHSVQQSRVCIMALDDGSFSDSLIGHFDNFSIG